MTDYVIIVAGGKGLRMGSDVPKQFLPIGGRPVLMRTIERFHEYSADLQIILVLPEAQQQYWQQLCREYDFSIEYQLANGGETRFHSVRNGLALISDDAEGVVGVHDGVRPFPSTEVIRRCYETARESGAAVPVVPVVETLRHIASTPRPAQSEGTKARAALNSPKQSPQSTFPMAEVGGGFTVPRDEYRLVQTPQAFGIQLLKAANRQPYRADFTDDASVVEAYGHDITLVEGNRENIKITTPYDLRVAEALI